MSEQVINIRDRIEKMRTQMTGPNESVVRNKIDLEKKNTGDSADQNVQINNKQGASIKTIESKKKNDSPFIQEKINKVDKQNRVEDVSKKVYQSKETYESDFGPNKSQISSASKTYKDYHNDNIYDENKKSVRLDEDQAFPQFNLNVSNPISWKLMLLIMLMQLLTNIMLVVVLYLK